MKSHRLDNNLVSVLALLAGATVATAIKLAFSSFEEEDAEPDTTDELLRNPRNAARLMDSIASLRRGEWESHPLATRPPVAP